MQFRNLDPTVFGQCLTVKRGFNFLKHHKGLIPHGPGAADKSDNISRAIIAFILLL